MYARQHHIYRLDGSHREVLGSQVPHTGSSWRREIWATSVCILSACEVWRPWPYVSVKFCIHDFPWQFNGRQSRAWFDNGATASFISVRFAHQLGISGMGEPTTLQVGDRCSTCTTEGDVIVTVCWANYKTRWHCHVFDMHLSYDLILGQDYYLACKGDLRYNDGSVLIRKGKRTVTLQKQM